MKSPQYKLVSLTFDLEPACKTVTACLRNDKTGNAYSYVKEIPHLGDGLKMILSGIRIGSDLLKLEKGLEPAGWTLL